MGRYTPQRDSRANPVTTAIEIAFFLTGLGLLATIPCLVNTTPITMTMFFFLGIPLFMGGFIVYLYAVIRDLRSHGVM
jgi:hypothetical protein